jgi:uncharacterized protein
MPVERALTSSSEGILLRIHVTPGASKTVFPAGYNEWRHALEAKLHAPAQENQANEELIKVLAGFFHLRPQDLRIKTGQSSREKTVLITHSTETSLLKKLMDAGYELPRNP